MQNNKELKAGNCRYIDYSALKEDNPVNYTLLKKEGGTGSDRILNINKEREETYDEDAKKQENSGFGTGGDFIMPDIRTWYGTQFCKCQGNWE